MLVIRLAEGAKPSKQCFVAQPSDVDWQSLADEAEAYHVTFKNMSDEEIDKLGEFGGF